MKPSGDDDLLKGTWWFPLRRYLPGWGLPVCWQGWLVLAAYAVLLVAVCPLLPKRHFGVYIVSYLCALTSALFIVIWRKGEPPR
jgi:hypothetical protein